MAACWSPATPRIGTRGTEEIGLRRPEISGAVPNLGQHNLRHPDETAEIVVPAALMDVVEQRTGGVGRISGMYAAPGHSPDQIAVDCSKQQVTVFGLGTSALDVVENPGDLGAREIGIE